MPTAVTIAIPTTTTTTMPTAIPSIIYSTADDLVRILRYPI